MKQKTLVIAGGILILIGVALIAFDVATAVDYYAMLTDKNGDGVINWHDADVNRDGVLDVFDSIAIANAQGSHLGDSNYNINADLDSNNVINVVDGDIFTATAHKFGFLTLAWTDYFNTTTSSGQMGIVGLLSLLLGFGVAGYARFTMSERKHRHK